MKPFLAGIRVYLITDSAPQMQPLESFLAAAIEAGVGMVQLRDRNLTDGELLAVSRRCVDICSVAGVPLIVNNRVDVALAAGANGVHLGQEDLPVAAVRELAGSDFIVGLSTHSPAQIDAARALAVDYVGVGPIWETPTKPGRPAVGLNLVRYAASHLNKPFFAIGGIDPTTVTEVLAAGAKGVSVLRWITQAQDPPAAVSALLAKFPNQKM